jgi:hypothetical protein
MAIDGTWNVTVNSPMGAQKSKVTLAANGETLTGAGIGPDGAKDIADGKVSGDAVSWKVDVTSPFPMTLEFAGKVEGDTIAGQVKAGAFGAFPFTGERA